jgi:lipid A 3-O-deacylase
VTRRRRATPRAVLRLLPHVFAAGMVLAAGPAAGAEEENTPSLGDKVRDAQLQLFIENDKWHRTDRNYTNGLKIGVGILEKHIPREVGNVFRSLLAGTSKRSDEVHFGLFLGQNMYTPRDITVAAPQPFDRPWAGWLYLGLVGQRVAKTPRVDTLDTLEVDVGVVGKDSFGADTQSWWHDQLGAPRPEGWGNQIPNEPGFLVSYLHKRRYGGKDDGFDFIPHAGASLGTVATYARAGGTVRYGFNKTGFGPDRIEPGGAMLQGAREYYVGGNRDSVEAFVFAGVDARLVAYNIFLDGTVFHDSAGVDRRPFVYDLLAGVSARWKFLRVSLTSVLRSEEFTTPRGGGGSQRFHSLNVGFEF